MRHLYSLLIYLITPLALGYFMLRGIADRRWWLRLHERLGFVRSAAVGGGIWVHAVSVGEVNAATPLVRALQQRWPQMPLTMSCFTPTGSERIAALHGDSVRHIYLPIDLPGAVRRAFSAVDPKILIVMETEIWPNLFERAEPERGWRGRDPT
jgi:3-deoxy-D-manno-octulosonic-acid transferase